MSDLRSQEDGKGVAPLHGGHGLLRRADPSLHRATPRHVPARTPDDQARDFALTVLAVEARNGHREEE